MGAHLVVNGWFWGQLNTGSGQYLHHLVRCLPKVAPDLACTLVFPQAVDAKAQGDQETAARALSGWNVVGVSLPFARIDQDLAKVWFEQVSFPRLCRRARADVALTPYWGSPWWRPCPTGVTVHDLIPLLLPDYRGGPLQRLYTRLVSATARRADVVLTDSQASRRDIITHLGIPAARVHAVPLAVDERYRPVDDEAVLARVRQAYALPASFILYLGGFDVRKNVPAVIRGYAQFLRDADSAAEKPCLVIGGRLPAVDSHFTPDPRRVVAAEGIEDWVHFTGWVAEADKPALYSLAAAFLFPSLYEGFGLPVAEAAACGAPVVTSNNSSLPEAGPGAILVDPNDVAAIAAGLTRALKQGAPAAGAQARTWRDVARETYRALMAAESNQR